MNIEALSPEDKVELYGLLKAREQKAKENNIVLQFPDEGQFARNKYVKHLEFFQAGAMYDYRLFMAANRVGKTHGAGVEVTYHLTGEYPDWWTGKRFDRPQDWWICGIDAKLIRDSLQPLLLGAISEFGTGLIPKRCLDLDSIKEAKKADTPISRFRVKHKSGGFSSVEFKSYESGRESFQATAKCIWLDEEPPLSVFTECLLRTATGGNILMMTFTPLKGISETILNFLEGSKFVEGPVGVGKFVTMAGWDDVPHLDEKAKAQLLAAIPPYQRDARTKGIPQLGSGAIYPVPESEYLIQPFEIPDHWPRMYGMDVGWKKTANVWLAQDPLSKVVYITGEYYRGEVEPGVHAVAIKARGDWIPGVIDSAAHGRTQTDGENLFDMYVGQGLDLRNANKAVETGLQTVWQMFSEGRIKVFNTLTNFMDEIRIYRRDEKGKVIKEKDHLMDAFRYAIMGLEHAQTYSQARPPAYDYTDAHHVSHDAQGLFR